MFAESMLETSWAQRSRRSWTTLSSFALQAAIVGSVIVLSLLKSVVMPTAQVVSTPITLGRPEPTPLVSQTTTRAGSSVQIIPVSGRIMAPTRVPNFIPRGDDSAVQAPSIGSGGSIGLPYGSPNGLNLPIAGSRPMPVAPPVPQPTIREFRRSNLLEGNLIRSVQPVYPPLAKSARIQGPVVLEAVISKAGTIDHLRLVSGHPMLAGAAIEAVRQWLYRPYILNNEPIEVETQITVNFTLSGN